MNNNVAPPTNKSVGMNLDRFVRLFTSHHVVGVVVMVVITGEREVLVRLKA